MNNSNGKSILIHWPARTVIEVIVPLLPIIAKNFKIFLIIASYSPPKNMIEVLNSLKDRGVLINYYVTPNHKKLLGNIKEISVVDFDHSDVVRHPLVSKIVKAYSDQTND